MKRRGVSGKKDCCPQKVDRGSLTGKQKSKAAGKKKKYKGRGARTVHVRERQCILALKRKNDPGITDLDVQRP